MRLKIHFRRVYGRSEESAKNRSKKLSQKYGFVIIDELIMDSMHIVLTDLTQSKVDEIKKESMVLDITEIEELTF